MSVYSWAVRDRLTGEVTPQRWRLRKKAQKLRTTLEALAPWPENCTDYRAQIGAPRYIITSMKRSKA
jgi:hypothetical protein